MKKIVFLTGTRADFGKLKSLLRRLHISGGFQVYIFVTGMHMLSKYGSTYLEVEKFGCGKQYHYINQNDNDSMDTILAKTISGFSDYVKELQPDMIVVHGDRVEALAGAIVGSLNNILLAHIEGGELSGAIDGSIRHAVSKLAHLHFVANARAKARLIQLGEVKEHIYVIGSPDIDIMVSNNLPSLKKAKQRYEIDFASYGILLFHSVTTELDRLANDIKALVDQVLQSNKCFIVIYPNNDYGKDIILHEYQRLENHSRFRIFPSIRFEYFLTLMKNAQFVLGNSSCGVREAPFYGVPAINVGSRQQQREKLPSILDVDCSATAIKRALALVENIPQTPKSTFGEGCSDELFVSALQVNTLWQTPRQKYFVDMETAQQPIVGSADYLNIKPSLPLIKSVSS